MTISVLSVASEMVPLVKTGGLADVAGALPAALAPHGVAVTSLVPGYRQVMTKIGKAKAVHRYDNLFGVPARVVKTMVHDQPVLILDAPALFDRDGGPYSDATGQDWTDNWRRFAALSRAAADIAGGAIKGHRFDLMHAHDWQTGLAPAYLKFAPPKSATQVRSVMTIHNIAFQGRYSRDIFAALGLPQTAWSIEGVEYHGGVGLLKAGIEAADAITTVSPSYAAEVRTPEFGMGLEGAMQAKGDRFTGIVNGIDTSEWDPETDPAIAASYSVRHLSARKANKRALEAGFGLDRDDGPLFIVVSRLTWQKGLDRLIEVLDHLVGLGGRLAVLGSGDAAMEAAFQVAAARFPGRIGVRIGYDEALSHQMQAGGDAILIPSRFEPCGLTQLYGLAYGCVPVVARTGGLADTVIDANVAALTSGVATGFVFAPVSAPTLAHAITRTVEVFRQPTLWSGLQRRGMKSDFSWGASGRLYADLYARLIRPTDA